MERYLNKDGSSGVEEFEISTDAIELIFEDRKFLYTYNQIRPGKSYVEEMKKKAVDGEGLNTYVNQYIRKNFYSKRPLN